MIKASYVTSADRNSRATKRAQQVSRQDRVATRRAKKCSLTIATSIHAVKGMAGG